MIALLLAEYICLFFIYGILGWVYESLFCILKTKKWEKRGFLFGPCCPIYGFGAVAISLIAALLPASPQEPLWAGLLRIFLISVFGSMILEYATSVALEKAFHAVWWDYSDMPFNLNGRISLFSTLGFGAAGILVVYVIAPPFEQMMSFIPPLVLELMTLVFVGVSSADLTLTVSALTDFERRIAMAEGGFNDRMEVLVDDLYRTMDRFQQAAVCRIKSFRYPKISHKSLAQFRTMIVRRFSRH